MSGFRFGSDKIHNLKYHKTIPIQNLYSFVLVRIHFVGSVRLEFLNSVRSFEFGLFVQPTQNTALL